LWRRESARRLAANEQCAGGSGHLHRLILTSVPVLDRTAFCKTPAAQPPFAKQLTSFVSETDQGRRDAAHHR
jgi:hypothetical protein